MDNQPTARDLLATACRNFMRNVGRGEEWSTENYLEIKEALAVYTAEEALSPAVPPVNAQLLSACIMFRERLGAYEVARVVMVGGPDDPRGRKGALAYRGTFTNGEMMDVEAAIERAEAQARDGVSVSFDRDALSRVGRETLKDSARCAVCGFPLYYPSAYGCVPGECHAPRPVELYDAARAMREGSL